MSHISYLKTKITNRTYLFEALKDLGYEYEEGDFQIGGFGGRKASVQIRIRIPWSADIGLREKNGAFEIVADWWGVRSLDKNTFVAKLLQRYAYRATIGVLQEKGFSLATEERQANGQIHLVLRKLG